MKTSKITIGRLYNLGNYEHIRYEITVEVGEGEDATTALIGLENILAAINPKRPAGVLSPGEIKNAEERIETLEAKSEDDVARDYGKSKVVIVAEWRKKLADAVEKSRRWDIMQQLARRHLGDLGAAEKFVDAKQDWGDDYDNDF